MFSTWRNTYYLINDTPQVNVCFLIQVNGVQICLTWMDSSRSMCEIELNLYDDHFKHLRHVSYFTKNQINIKTFWRSLRKILIKLFKPLQNDCRSKKETNWPTEHNFLIASKISSRNLPEKLFLI